MGSQPSNLNQLVSFLLGASLATALLFFFVSGGDGGARSAVDISTWGNGTLQVAATPEEAGVAPGEEANLTSTATADEAKGEEQELKQLLERVATEDRTIIMTSVNAAWAAPNNSLLDLFLESFRGGDGIEHFIKHLLVVAVDAEALERCRAVHPHCYLLKVAGADLSGEKVFMSKDYLDLVWSKVQLQQKILQLGYNFLFSDVDVMWFRDPFEGISVAAHMATSSDFYFGDPYSPANFPNTGFIYVKSSRRSVEMLEAWRGARERFPGKHEQQVFNEIKAEVVARGGLKVQFLDPKNYGGFCSNTRDFNTLYTMHANCCVGLAAKLHDLRNLLGEWRQYRAMPEEQRRRGPVRWRVPGICIH